MSQSSGIGKNLVPSRNEKKKANMSKGGKLWDDAGEEYRTEPESLGEHIKETEGYSKYNEKP